MKILAFEFSSPLRSVALVDAAPGCAPRVIAERSVASGRHTPALTLTEEILDQQGLAPADVEGLAAGIGPGSFLGIRQALALAQGWRLGRRIPIFPIPVLEILARQTWESGRRGRVHFAVDAQRGEFGVAEGDFKDHGPPVCGAWRLEPRAAIEELGRGGAVVIGPDLPAGWAWAETLPPRAGVLGCLAANREPSADPGEIKPIHLRTTAFVKAPPARVVPPLK